MGGIAPTEKGGTISATEWLEASERRTASKCQASPMILGRLGGKLLLQCHGNRGRVGWLGITQTVRSIAHNATTAALCIPNTNIGD